MPTGYTGDLAVYPETLTIPSDGDDPKVASVNPAIEGLADRTEYLRWRYRYLGSELWSRADSDSPSNYVSFTTEDYVEYAPTEKVFTVTAGDVLMIDSLFQAFMTPDGGTGLLRIIYQYNVEGSPPKVEICSARVTESGYLQMVGFASQFTAATDGELRVVLEGKVLNDAYVLALSYAASLRVVHHGRGLVS